MNQDEIVIFAELNRSCFPDICQTMESHFPLVQYGSQCDDWLWIHHSDGKVEIDSFNSLDYLELRGPRKQFGFVQVILNLCQTDWIVARYLIPKIDLTRGT